MAHPPKRTKMLLAIIFYKCFTAGLLIFTSITLLMAYKNYNALVDFTDQYSLVGKRESIKFILNKLTDFSAKKIELAGIAMMLYGILSLVESIGLWYQKIWAEILVLVMVGIGVFPEIYEIAKEVKPVKIVILIINLIVFGYLAQKLYKEFQHRKSAPPN
jgi:uncharacterized membrane protein (DUF2068 family)